MLLLNGILFVFPPLQFDFFFSFQLSWFYLGVHCLIIEVVGNYVFMSCFLFVFTQTSSHWKFISATTKRKTCLSSAVCLHTDGMSWTPHTLLRPGTDPELAFAHRSALSMGHAFACWGPPFFPLQLSPCVVLRCVPACVVCAGPLIICPRAANCLPSHHNCLL